LRFGFPVIASLRLERHEAVTSIEEIVDRFGHGLPEREVEIRELMELIAWAKQHSVRRLIINGSFVTEKRDPNDVDVVLLTPGGMSFLSRDDAAVSPRDQSLRRTGGRGSFRKVAVPKKNCPSKQEKRTARRDCSLPGRGLLLLWL
jgi:hypothetical protein